MKPLTMEVIARRDDRVHVVADDGETLTYYEPITEQGWHDVLAHPAALAWHIIDPQNNET